MRHISILPTDKLTIDWLPKSVRLYIAHTECGVSMRRLAKVTGCHASTISRRVRKIEAQRDDPLVDAALREFGPPNSNFATGNASDMTAMMTANSDPETTKAMDPEIRRILRRLAEPGSLLAVAEGMEKAIVLRDTGSGESARTAVVDTGIAQKMALEHWISCETPGRVARYHITQSGRAELRRLLADGENQATGFAEAPAEFRSPRRSVNVESPLLALSRRRDRDGNRFLSAALVAAGERLREDFELSHLETRTTQNWDAFLTGPSTGQASGSDPFSGGAGAARERVATALRELGPGLGDIALRCCCYLEGLEKTEKRMGWSSRSGKIVLRIALQRLKRHYEDTHGPGGGLIG